METTTVGRFNISAPLPRCSASKSSIKNHSTVYRTPGCRGEIDKAVPSHPPDSIEAAIRKLSSNRSKRTSAFDEIFAARDCGAKERGSRPGPPVSHPSRTRGHKANSRARLREAHSVAAAEQRNYTMEEIIKIQISCLDATIEEANRTAQIFNGSIRPTTVDTTLLGHSTPQGH
ncbi:hypothetical protein FOPE_08326 [Fonsecaea pedrosoi]|nr:hypothetical protein FOPE_08326 [Fonsecaea pedrosoi]